MSVKAARRKLAKAKDETETKAKTPAVRVKPRTAAQAEALQALHSPVAFLTGPAGVGKTYLAGRHYADLLFRGLVKQVIVTRVTAGERRHNIGFLPGTADEKMEPWVAPIMGALREGLGAQGFDAAIQNKTIQIVPFNFMRGMTFSDAAVVLDEAQNCTLSDLKLFLTRVGENSFVAVCGDPEQTDIPDSGLTQLTKHIPETPLVSKVAFSRADVVRSPVAAFFVEMFHDLNR